MQRAEVRRTYQGPLAADYVLHLTFENGRTTLTSRSYAGVGASRDQSVQFAGFCRRLLDLASAAAPRARFLRGPSRFAATLTWALVLLGGGAVLTLLFAAVSGPFFALGLDLSARMLFALFILGAAWPWLVDERRRSFDPASEGADVLPRL